MLDEIFDPFVKQSPITVMAGAALARLLSNQRLDEIFEQARRDQYSHRLLFSTAFSLMAGVVSGTRKSVFHAYQSAKEEIGVSASAVYDKLKHIEPATSRALVGDLAGEMTRLIDQMGGALEPLAPGYQVRILDGNCIAASEHRIKELRTTAAGALPGKSLAVLDPQRRLILDVFPCEDGHAQERALLDQVVPTINKGELWIDDRNFCTFGFLAAIQERQAFFITREHAKLPCQVLAPLKELGNIQTGAVYEQPVRVRNADGRELCLRRIELHLDQPTRDGEDVIRMLTNLPAFGSGAVDGLAVAMLYGSRWKIETAFQELAQHLNSEINALGYPKAALFGFCVALVIYNAISLMMAALRGRHGARKVEEEVSSYYIAAELETTSRGMMIAIPPEHWDGLGQMAPAQFVAVMLFLAGKVNLEHFRKHTRGPKKPQPRRTYDPAHPHVSTARLLELRTQTNRPNT